jgi:hypothetical protein
MTLGFYKSHYTDADGVKKVNIPGYIQTKIHVLLGLHAIVVDYIARSCSGTAYCAGLRCTKEFVTMCYFIYFIPAS